MDRLLTFDTDQEINANVTIHGNILLTNDTNIEVNHLNQNNGTIFDVNLSELLDDCYFNPSNENLIVTQPKWFQRITIDQLIIECDFWGVGRTTEEIHQYLEDLKTGLSVKGPITFHSHFNINNLTVIGTINDIPAERFGRNWLRSQGSQVN